MKSTLLFSSLLTLSAVGIPTERLTTHRHSYPGPADVGYHPEVDVGIVTDGEFAFDREQIKLVMSKVEEILPLYGIEATVKYLDQKAAEKLIVSHTLDEMKKIIIFGNVQKLENVPRLQNVPKNDPELDNVKRPPENVYAHQYLVVGYVDDNVNRRVVVILPDSPDRSHDRNAVTTGLSVCIVRHIVGLWTYPDKPVSEYGTFVFGGIKVKAMRPVHPEKSIKEEDPRAPSPPLFHRKGAKLKHPRPRYPRGYNRGPNAFEFIRRPWE